MWTYSTAKDAYDGDRFVSEKYMGDEAGDGLSWSEERTPPLSFTLDISMCQDLLFINEVCGSSQVDFVQSIGLSAYSGVFTPFRELIYHCFLINCLNRWE
jgi:hypothetical protein